MIGADKAVKECADPRGEIRLGLIRALRRWLRSTAAPVLLFLLLIGDVVLIANSEKHDGFLGGLRINWRQPSAVIIRGEEGVEFSDSKTGDGIGVAVLWHQGAKSGLWAPTTNISKTGVRIVDGSQTIPPAELGPLRGKFLDWLVAAGELPSARAETLRSQDVDESRVLWGGYVHNAAALALALMFVWTLCVLSITKWKQVARRGRNRDRCARCQYDLRGLPTPRCPECGEEFRA